MQGLSDNDVFCDYIRCTYSPENSPAETLIDYVSSKFLCQIETKTNPDRTHVLIPAAYGLTGRLSIFWNYGQGNPVTLISIPGRCLERFRDTDTLCQVIQILASTSHNVKRIDLARDRERSNVNAVYQELQTLKRKGFAGNISLSNKPLKPSDVTPFLKPRELDNALSGSVYFGDPKTHRYTLCVYDKRGQLASSKGGGVIIQPEIIRYEMRTSEATLADVLNPDPLFFKIVAPDVMRKPASVPEWEKRPFLPLSLPPLPEKTMVERCQTIIDCSRDLDRLCALLEGETDAAKEIVLSRLKSRLGLSDGPFAGMNKQEKYASCVSGEWRD